MVRYYRRRTYRKAYPRKKWASNIGNSSITMSIPANSVYAAGAAFALNPAQSPSTVSNSYLVKNVKLSIEPIVASLESPRGLNQLIAAIMYVPQGYTVGPAILNEHPEWIMAVKYLGDAMSIDISNVQDRIKPFTVSSRLSRRLQTGDSVQLVLFAQNSTSGEIPIAFRFLAQWWTRTD
nr:MAG: capsid protein [Cressdnaviricota sp.]